VGESILKILQQRSNERNEIIQNLNNSSDSNKVAEDEIEAFFKYMAMSVRKLSPLMISEAKMKIFNVVSELEFRSLQMSQPSPSTTSLHSSISEASAGQNQSLLDYTFLQSLE
jgi:Mg2+/Co2+ transporter CorC